MLNIMTFLYLSAFKISWSAELSIIFCITSGPDFASSRSLVSFNCLIESLLVTATLIEKTDYEKTQY